MKPEKYHLTTGDKGNDQLNFLERACGKNSRLFLKNIGIRPGMTILDVGCGNGHMSCWLAKEVGPHGQVIAIDNSEQQLEQAKIKAESERINNISFHLNSAYELTDFNLSADITYCRWLLYHLNDPLKACLSMANTVKLNGILACEVGCANTSLFYPPFQAYDTLMAKALKLILKVGNDPFIGLNVFGLLQQLPSFDCAKIHLAQNVWTQHEDITLALQGMMTMLSSIEPALIENEICTAAEIKTLKSELTLFQIPKDALMLSTRMTQIWATKVA